MLFPVALILFLLGWPFWYRIFCVGVRSRYVTYCLSRHSLPLPARYVTYCLSRHSLPLPARYVTYCLSWHSLPLPARYVTYCLSRHSLPLPARYVIYCLSRHSLPLPARYVPSLLIDSSTVSYLRQCHNGAVWSAVVIFAWYSRQHPTNCSVKLPVSNQQDNPPVTLRTRPNKATEIGSLFIRLQSGSAILGNLLLICCFAKSVCPSVSPRFKTWERPDWSLWSFIKFFDVFKFWLRYVSTS